MTIQLGQTAPDFEQDSTHGRIRFHDWLGSSWAVLFSHPKNFTPVCTTELGEVARLRPEWDKRNVKPIGLSIDPVEAHHKWEEDITETQDQTLDFPMIADPDVNNADVSRRYTHDTIRPVSYYRGEKKVDLGFVGSCMVHKGDMKIVAPDSPEGMRKESRNPGKKTRIRSRRRNQRTRRKGGRRKRRSLRKTPGRRSPTILTRRRVTGRSRLIRSSMRSGSRQNGRKPRKMPTMPWNAGRSLPTREQEPRLKRDGRRGGRSWIT